MGGLQEMQMDGSDEDLFVTETTLMRDGGGVFNIVRNKDVRQTIYPVNPYAVLETCNPVMGPDQMGRAYYWYLQGKAGDVFKIELRRVYEEGSVSLTMNWTKLRHESLSREQLHDGSRSQFY